MFAVVKSERKYGGIEIKKVAKPKVTKSNQVLVKVKSAALCGSDIHAYEYPQSYEFINVPVILGHEFCGVIKEIGDKVNNFNLDDVVMGESNKYCQVCENCREGKTNICYNSKMTGLHVDGVMAEYVLIDDHLLHKVPQELTFTEGAVAQASTISVRALEKTKIVPGDTVVVFGPGIVGQTAAQLARIKGTAYVFVVGTTKDEALRLPVARQMGFKTVVIDKETVESALKKNKLPLKVDVVIECSGTPSAFLKGAELLKKGGQLTVVGIYNKPFEISLTNMVRNELVINTSYTSTWFDYEKTLALIASGALKVKDFCKEYPFKDAEKAFQEAISKEVTKPVLIFSQ